MTSRTKRRFKVRRHATFSYYADGMHTTAPGTKLPNHGRPSILETMCLFSNMLDDLHDMGCRPGDRLLIVIQKQPKAPRPKKGRK